MNARNHALFSLQGEVQREGIFLKSVSSNSYGVDEHIVRGTMEAAVARTLS